jgi:hypothetical protein
MSQALKVLVTTPHKDILPSNPQAMTLASNLTPTYGPAKITRGTEIKSYRHTKVQKRSVGRSTDKSHSSTHYSSMTIVILETSTPQEYRVGWVKEKEFGNLRPNGDLNSEIAIQCFASSPVFADDAAAESYAFELFDQRFKELVDEEISLKLPTIKKSQTSLTLQQDAETEARRALCGGVKKIHVTASWPK